MEVQKAHIPGVLIIQPKVFGDSRGYFLESYHLDRYKEFGLAAQFVQDNISFSAKGVLRGLHLQNPKSQGKLIYVIKGSVFDVVVDVRIGSPTFGEIFSTELSEENKRQVYIPPGLAHGFYVTSDQTFFIYKSTDFYDPSCEMTILWNDPDLAIKWPLTDKPQLSEKDKRGLPLRSIFKDKLPKFVT